MRQVPALHPLWREFEPPTDKKALTGPADAPLYE